MQVLKAVRAADTTFNRKEYQKAALKYKKAISMDHRQPIAWFRLALCYHKLGNIAEAVRNYEHAFELEKAFEIALNKGMAYLLLKDVDNAIRSFTQAIAADQGSETSRNKGQAFFQMGRAHLVKEEPRKASNYFERSEKCE